MFKIKRMERPSVIVPKRKSPVQRKSVTTKPTTSNDSTGGTTRPRARTTKGSNVKLHHGYVRASLFKDLMLINPVPLDNNQWKVEIVLGDHKLTPIAEGKEEMNKICKKVLEYQKKFGNPDGMLDKEFVKMEDDVGSEDDIEITN
jgi:hypothetical protein